MCGIIGKPVDSPPKQSLAVQVSHGTVGRSHLLPPLASWSGASWGNVRMLSVLSFLVLVAMMVPAMARDLCLGGECKCNGIVATCSGQDIKVI